jgi:site-specific recombinase XerC
LKREVDLSDVECEAIVRTAELKGEVYYLFVELIGAQRGMRVGEVTGVKGWATYTRWVDRKDPSKGKETVKSTTDLPGIYTDDLRDGAVWIHRKGGKLKRILLPMEFYQRLVKYARTLGPGKKLFPFRERQGYDVFKRLAREAGLRDWELVHPHRMRHYFITRADRKFPGQPKVVQQLAGHASYNTTLRYIGKLTPEEEREKLEELAG